MSTLPTISVAMATYNGEAYLQAQLDSLAAQTVLPIELQIGDDGSTDRTEKIIRDFASVAPFPVNLTRNAERLGYANNFIETAQRCSGDYIAFCDQDDLWFPNKLSRVAGFLAANTKLNFVSHAVILSDDGAIQAGRVYQTATRRGMTLDTLERPLLWAPLGWTQVFSRRLLAFEPGDRAPSPYRDVDPFPHDFWMSLLGNLVGGVLEIDEPLGLYRRHESTITKAGKDSVVRPTRLIGSAEYASLAASCEEIATVLSRHSQRNQDPACSSVFNLGKEAYARYADLLRKRASLHEASTLRKRLRIFARILLDGGYKGENNGSLRRRSILKDLAKTFALNDARPK